MTDEELVVQAIQKTMGQTTRETLWIERDAARAVVAALREAGRLLPDGWTWPKDEKVIGFCVDGGEMQPFLPAWNVE